MTRTPEKVQQHPDPRWIDGRRIINQGMAHHTGENGKVLRYRVGMIVVDEILVQPVRRFRTPENIGGSLSDASGAEADYFSNAINGE